MKNTKSNNNLRELGAVLLFQMVVEELAKSKKITINEAIDFFTKSKYYEAIFDFDSGLWKESPFYILELMEDDSF